MIRNPMNTETLMPNHRPFTISFAILSAFQAGWILSGFLGDTVARAESPTESGPTARDLAETKVSRTASESLRCRRFTADLEKNPQTDTADRTTEIGRWVGEQAGYSVDSVDFEIGPKPTGYAQGWVQVCLKQPIEGLLRP